MKMNSLQDFYVDELRDIFDAENQLLKALPKMAKAASSDDLRAALEDHLDQTQGHVERLERVFEELGTKPKAKKCEAMKGLIEECKSVLGEEADPDVMDAAIICAAQKIEHYEIATYGCLRTYAEQLGHEEQAELLEETLNEEKDADENLTELATTCINWEASRNRSETEEQAEA